MLPEIRTVVQNRHLDICEIKSWRLYQWQFRVSLELARIVALRHRIFGIKRKLSSTGSRVSKADLSEWDAICTHKALGLLQDSRWRKSRKSSFLLRAITPRRNTCAHKYVQIHIHTLYVSYTLSEKWGKGRERKLPSRGERERKRRANATRDDGICKSPCTSLFPPLFTILPILVQILISPFMLLSSISPVRCTFLASDLRVPRISHSRERSC